MLAETGRMRYNCSMLAWVLLLVLLALVLWGILHAVTGDDRYARMTEEEFEAEAKRVSMMGAGMVELQKHIDPLHKVEYMQQQDKKVEGEADESGDRPPEGPGPPQRS